MVWQPDDRVGHDLLSYARHAVTEWNQRQSATRNSGSRASNAKPSRSPAKSAEERGDTAREIIARLNASSDKPDYVEARARAQEFQADGRLADAQLLYFFAARGGHGPAAFDLATFYDPNHHSATSSIVAEPDPFQAYRWYVVARDAGRDGASERLDALRAWAESASQSGNNDAERLLLQWEHTQ